MLMEATRFDIRSPKQDRIGSSLQSMHCCHWGL
jgi:hypothetical protein